MNVESKLKFHNEVWFEHVENSGKVIRTSKKKMNMVVETGAELALDTLFGLDTWGTKEITHGAVGISLDTNDGVVGPTNGSPIPVTGADWTGVDRDDWRLSSEVARAGITTITRNGSTVLAQITFDASLFGTGTVHIQEAGLFLSVTPPAANPQYVSAQRANAMFARCLWYAESGGQAYYDPEIKYNDGTNLKMYYQVEVL